MNDFLQNLRTNSNAQKEKRFNGNRRQFDSSNYGGNDRRTGPERRTGGRPMHQKPAPRTAENSPSDESLKAMCQILSNIEKNQLELIEAENRKADAEEQKAEAFASMAYTANQLAEMIGNAIQSGILVPVASPQAGYGIDDMDHAPRKRKSRKRPISPERQKILDLINEMRNKGATYHEIADYLTTNNYKTFSGRGIWHAQTIHRLCQ